MAQRCPNELSTRQQSFWMRSSAQTRHTLKECSARGRPLWRPRRCILHRGSPIADRMRLAAPNKCLVTSNKYRMGGEATKERENPETNLGPPDEADNQNQVHRTTNCARDARASKLQSRPLDRVMF